MPPILNTIFMNHRRSLLSVVMRIVRNRQIAEDVVQEAYLRAHKTMDTRPVEHVEGFLYQTARNLALDHTHRAKVRQKYEVSDTPATDIENIATDARSTVDDLIARQQQAI